MSEEITFTDLQHPPVSVDPEVLFSILDRQCASYLPASVDRALLARAYARAAQLHQGNRRDSGEPYITHPLHVAIILAHLQLDLATLAAALLHDVLEDTGVTQKELADEFGAEIAGLVEGVTKLTQVSEVSRVGQSAANIQKVFVAMSEDIRVIVLKLADRLHNLRTLQGKRDSYSRTRSATEALEVYARIADRLGIAILRKEMEDIAFSYLSPVLYEQVKSLIEKRYRDRAALVARVERELAALLRSEGIQAVEPGVQPNPNRVYDMYHRMQEESNPRSGRPKRVPPLLRFHVIVPDVPSCYLAMAAIHAYWQPIASETRDYISAPLANGYQSLHTTVFIDRLPIKFQIRTALMHRTSQLGIIAHMREGEWPAATPALKETIDNLRRFGLEAVRELGDPVEFLVSLKSDILGDDLYVYTPKNRVIQLPVGATPVDFAFHIHTDVGYRCRGALVDGRWVALNRPLRTGEQVEILLGDRLGPQPEWLDPDLGYTNSPVAKSKIRRWFRRRPHAERLALGRQQLCRIVDRLALDVQDFSTLAKRCGYQSEDEFLAGIGGCDLAMERVLAEMLLAYGEPSLPPIHSSGASDTTVIGVGSLDKHLASCCHPQPGDDIVGYITQGQLAVEVHCSGCPTLLNQVIEDKTRLVEVKWGTASTTYLACVEIHSLDRPFFLRDVWNVISEKGINVSDVRVQVNRAQDATIVICVDIESWVQFNGLLARIQDLPGAISVKRVPPPGI
jgi:RelA/SpoT family (p)ppGpp synthetase